MKLYCDCAFFEETQSSEQGKMDMKIFDHKPAKTAFTLLAGALGTCISLSAQGEPSIFPTGTIRYEPAKAYNSFVLFTGGDKIARLIDLNGNPVHQWRNESSLITLIDPALAGGEPGHVLLTLATEEGSGSDLVPGRVGRRVSKTIGEQDWQGRTVWQFGEKAPGGRAQQHHDWARLPNGNTLVLANLVHPVPGFTLPNVLDDVVYEVNPEGEIVWTWQASDHIGEFGFTPEELKLVKESKNADYLHLNNLKVIGPNRWYDAGDRRFHPDNLLIDSRNANFIAIIDKQSGQIVWTLGPHYPAIGETGIDVSRKTPRPVDQISGQHDAHIIPAGLPGAGNLLVFDNQGEGGYPPAALTVTGGSRILEIDPVRKEIVWQYTAEDSGRPGWSFRSAHISNARRLPNGNTFIDEGEVGRFFQVTPAGEIVWEYINPYPSRNKDLQTGREIVNYQVYRAQPVPYEWVPAGMPHAENAVIPPDPGQFHLPAVK
jgi:hypothetical protein